MHNALNAFNQSIAASRQSGALFDVLKNQLNTSLNLDDLLRSQVVYAVSAFDKLMHDLIRIGMRMQFEGNRPSTAKFLAESITTETLIAMNAAVNPETPGSIYERFIFQKHSYLSFQDPDKISDGLSFVWNANHKWDLIATQMGTDAATLKIQLKLLITRRNTIVHEGDMDPMAYTKLPIAKNTADTWVDLISTCGNTIPNLVI